MIRIQQLKVPLNYDEALLRKEIARKLKIQASDIKELRVRKQSLDARKKPDLYYVLPGKRAAGFEKKAAGNHQSGYGFPISDARKWK